MSENKPVDSIRNLRSVIENQQIGIEIEIFGARKKHVGALKFPLAQLLNAWQQKKKTWNITLLFVFPRALSALPPLRLL